MIEEHTDPIAEVHSLTSNLLRTLLTALATLADRHAQRLHADQERQRHQSEAERRELEKRIEAERDAAHLAYRRVYDQNWWATVTPRKIADAVVAAGAWAGDDPRARDAWTELSEQLSARYGIDLDTLARESGGKAVPVEQVASGARDQVERAQKAGQAEPGGGPVEKGVSSKRRWEAEILELAGAELGAEIIAEEGWPGLQARLDKFKDAGQDPSARLSAAIAKGEFDTARDKASVLKFRVGNPTHQGQHHASGKHIKQSDPERLAQQQRAGRERGQEGRGAGDET